MRRLYKVALWSLIPLLLLGGLGVGLFSLQAPFARAAEGQAAVCDGPNNMQDNPVASKTFADLQIWECQLLPVFANNTVDCLHIRDQPNRDSNFISCFKLPFRDPLPVVCQVQGEVIGNSNVWDAVSAIDPDTKVPKYGYVADYFMATASKGFSEDTFPKNPANPQDAPIPRCPDPLPKLTLK